MKKRLSSLFLFLMVACGSSREAIINRTSVGLTAARTAFTIEDEQIQLTIVSASLTKAQADMNLLAHRRQRDIATKAFQAAWGALAVASLEPSDANMARLAELAAEAVASIAHKGPPSP